jgi:serine O-acetyltransferase
MGFLKDYQAYSIHSKSRIKPIFKTMLYCNLLFRLSHICYKLKLFPIGRLFWLFNRVLFSVDIDPRARIKGGMVILHGTGIVIGYNVLVKGNFKIYQGSTLGGNNGKKLFRDGVPYSQPILEDNITIGINAAVLGPIILYSGSSIGANAVVTKDVPPNAIIVSNNKIIGYNNY